jgi:iron complex outermembrane recepter protein
MSKWILVGMTMVFAAWAAVPVVHADDTSTVEGFESYSLGEVYVKGGKPPVAQEVAVTNVISAEDIKATGSRTVAEALSYATGVRVSTGRKNEPGINIRGLGQERTLILIDGVPYYETNYGKLDMNQIPTDNIAKIEITKGAASILYGPNALAGTVNIVTKQPTGKPFFEVTAEAGEVDYYRTSASHGAKFGIFSYWLNYSHSQTHGWRMSDGFVPRVGTISGNVSGTGIFEDGGTRNGSDYETNSIWAKFGIKPFAGSDYFVNFYYIDREKGVSASVIDNRINTSSSTRNAFSWFGRIPVYNDWGIDLSGQQKVNEMLTLKEKVFFHHHVDEYNSYSSPDLSSMLAATAGQAISKFKDYTVGGSILAEIKPVAWNTVRLTVGYRGDSHNERGETNVPFSRFYSFTGSTGIEDEITINNNFAIVVGGSYDWFKVTKAYKPPTSSSNKLTGLRDIVKPKSMNSFNPMIGTTYSFSDKTKLFASVARKTRFPTLQQLFSGTLSGQESNSQLKPEFALNSTVGVARAFSSFMWGEFAFFYNTVSDFISRDNRDNAYQNTQKIEMYGIEVNSEFYPLKDLTLRLGYTFNHASDQSSDAVTENVRDIPEHKLDLGVSYTVPHAKTKLDFNGTLISNVFNQLPTPRSPSQATQKVSGYFILNTRIAQPFLKHYEAYINFNNLLDKNYDSEYGFPASGRNIFGGITARF